MIHLRMISVCSGEIQILCEKSLVRAAATVDPFNDPKIIILFPIYLPPSEEK